MLQTEKRDPSLENYHVETEVLLKQASPDPNGSSFGEAARPLD